MYPELTFRIKFLPIGRLCDQFYPWVFPHDDWSSKTSYASRIYAVLDIVGYKDILQI